MNHIEYFVKGLFRGTEKTAESIEQQEELCCHIQDKVSDLMSTGLNESAAFEKVVEDLGDLNELIETLTGKRSGYT